MVQKGRNHIISISAQKLAEWKQSEEEVPVEESQSHMLP